MACRQVGGFCGFRGLIGLFRDVRTVGVLGDLVLWA